MWLKISFGYRLPLRAAVGKDGLLYFVAKDVGAFLGYSNRAGFAKRHGTRDLFRAVPPEFAVYMKKGEGPAFLFGEMMDKMRGTFWHHLKPAGEFTEIRDLFEKGTVTCEDLPDPAPFCPKLAHPVTVVESGEKMKFAEWLELYVARTLDLYETLNERIMVAPPSVESRFGEEKEECYSRTVTAEGAWCLKGSPTEFEDALLAMKRKFEEMERSEAEYYELQVKMIRKMTV